SDLSRGPARGRPREDRRAPPRPRPPRRLRRRRSPPPPWPILRRERRPPVAVRSPRRGGRSSSTRRDVGEPARAGAPPAPGARRRDRAAGRPGARAWRARPPGPDPPPTPRGTARGGARPGPRRPAVRVPHGAGAAARARRPRATPREPPGPFRREPGRGRREIRRSPPEGCVPRRNRSRDSLPRAALPGSRSAPRLPAETAPRARARATATARWPVRARPGRKRSGRDAARSPAPPRPAARLAGRTRGPLERGDPRSSGRAFRPLPALSRRGGRAREGEQNGSRRQAEIGDVEDPRVEPAEAEDQEVDHRTSAGEPVDQIADPARDQERKGEGEPPVEMPAAREIEPEHGDQPGVERGEDPLAQARGQIGAEGEEGA